MSPLSRVREDPLPPDWIRPSELEYMALTGEVEHVRSCFARLSPRRRELYGTPRVLALVVRGGVTRLRGMAGHAVRAAGDERALVQSVLRLLLDSGSGGLLPRCAFQALLEWGEYLGEASRPAEGLSVSETALSLGAHHYPDIYPRLVLLKASFLGARGRLRDAHAELSALYRRPDLISERRLIPALIRALGQTALHLGEAALFKGLFLEGLGAFYSNLDERRAILDSLCKAHRGAWRVLVSDGVGLAGKVLFLAHWACLKGAGVLGGKARAPLERVLLAFVYLRRYLRSGHRRADTGCGTEDQAAARVLVTRAMGGVGDLLMMTPGLHALARRHRGRLDLALPRTLFPVFENNPDVRLIDIHGDLDPHAYRRWFNLTDCPSARIESLTAPRVRRGRIEIFAKAMGIRGSSLRRMERRPRYVPTAAEIEERKGFYAAHGLTGRAVIGIQYRCEETYRDYPHMSSLVKALARQYDVLVFDSREIPDCEVPGAIKVVGRPLREAFALASGCRAIVAPDSAFVHLAAALELPCVALFGPTDGRVRTAEYPLCRFLDARRDLRCVPCWRNEVIPCPLTGRHASVCMAAIRVAAVVEAVRELLSEEPAGPACTSGRPSPS